MFGLGNLSEKGSPVRAAFRKRLLPLSIAAVSILGIYLLMATRSELSPVELSEQTWPVTVIVADHQDVRPQVKLFGEVVADRSSELRPLVAGQVIKLGEGFLEGGLVAQGDLLLQIDPFDYETGLDESRWMLQEAQVRLEMLQSDLKRAQELSAQNLVSEQFLESAELDVRQQEAVVGQKQVQLKRAERDLQETTLRAPYSGVLSNVGVNLGKHLSTGDKVADLIDTSRLEVRFSLSNAQYGRFLESSESVIGRPVFIAWTVGQEHLKYSAEIARVGAEIDSTTGGINAYAVIDTAGEQIPMRPGAFV